MNMLNKTQKNLNNQDPINELSNLNLYILGSVVLYIIWAWYSWGYIEDDAFIHLGYAKNIAESGSISFKGMHVNGDSSPAWIFLLAGLIKLIGNYFLSAKILSIFGVLIAVSGLYTLSKKQLNSNLLAYLFTLSIFSSPFTLHWSFSGMESITALGLTSWAIYFAFTNTPSKLIFFSACSFIGVLPLFRFELLPISLFVGTCLLISEETRTFNLKIRLISLIISSIPLVSWLSYSIIEFGSIVPTTNAAKHLFGNYSYWGGVIACLIKEAQVIFVGFGIPLIITLTGLLLSIKNRNIVAELKKCDLRNHISTIILILYPLACISFYVLDRISVQTRYVVFFLPLFILGLYSIFTNLRRRNWVIYAVSGALLSNIFFFYTSVQPHVKNKVDLVQNNSKFYNEIRLAIPENAPIAAFAIGQISLELQNPIIDIGGIMMPEAIPYMTTPDKMTEWAYKKGAECFVSSRKPKDNFEKIATVNQPTLGWHLSRSSYLQNSQTFLWCKVKTDLN